MGPGGGTVFYAASSPQSWGQYLEIAPQDWNGVNRQWSGICSKKSGIAGAFVNTIGGGKANTEILKQQCPFDVYCYYCGLGPSRYRGKAKTDWYTPSIAEIQAYSAYLRPGNRFVGEYGTILSSNLGSNFGQLVRLDNGGIVNVGIFAGNYNNVEQRPIRAFAPNLAPCRSGGVCRVGDVGPGGGIVFFVGEFVNTQTGETKYNMEFAPNGWAGRNEFDIYSAYCSKKSGLTGAFSTSLGTGQRNTAILQGQCPPSALSGSTNKETSYRGGGLSDWFMPSQAEAQKISENVVRPGLYDLGWRSGSIATSSATSDGYMNVNMSTGAARESTIYVNNYTNSPRRPIRYF